MPHPRSTRTGDALADLPTVRAAWESGELSTNKAQTVAGVATPESEASWRALALEASATQLSRIASAYRRHGPDTPAPDASDREQRCGAQFSTRDDGLVELIAVLEPDDAAVVRAALEARMEMSWRDGDADDAESGSETTSPAPTGQRMADALVDLAASAQANDPTPIVRGERTEVVLHVDHDFLAGRTQVGRCQLTNTPGLDWHGARRLSCDARVRAMVHGADGRAVDLGRSQRLVSDKQRRLLTERDHGCRFPGCGNSRYVDAHHVTHWEDGGTTDLANLILLCNRHHRLQHQDRVHRHRRRHRGLHVQGQTGSDPRPTTRQTPRNRAGYPTLHHTSPQWRQPRLQHRPRRRRPRWRCPLTTGRSRGDSPATSAARCSGCPG